MRVATLASLATLLATSSSATPSSYAFYFTDAGDCDNDDAPPSCESGPVMEMFLQKATFSSSGTLQNVVNLTSPFLGMGYLSTNPTGTVSLFASEDQVSGNVYTYAADLVNPKNAPSIILNNMSTLLVPCAPTCVEVSTFHNTYSVDGSTILFAFRNWDQYGNGVGSQGTAIANSDGSNMKILTYNMTGPEQGVNIFDTCPTPTTDASRVFFMRSADAGMSTYGAVVDVKTGETTILTQFPLYAPASGCSNYLQSADGVSVFYMGCSDPSACDFSSNSNSNTDKNAFRIHKENNDVKWGRAPAAAGKKSLTTTSTLSSSSSSVPPSPYYYYQVQMPVGSDPSSWKPTTMFQVQLTNTPDTVGSYATTQCDAIRGSGMGDTPLSCQGADPTHSFFQHLFVNSQGNSTEDSFNTIKVCMTPRCQLLQAQFSA